MPRRITRAVGVPADVRLPAEVLLFREDRGRRQADLALYLKRLRKAIPGMTVRVAETYLIGAGVPLSSSHISRLESPAKMAQMENINLVVIWTLVYIYNGDPDEVTRILYGRRPARSALAQEVQARHEKENGLVAAYRLLLEEGQETVFTITKALSQQQAAHLLSSSLAAPATTPTLVTPRPGAASSSGGPAFDEDIADALIDSRLASQEQRLAEALRQQQQQEQEEQGYRRRHATDSPSSS